MKAEPFSQELEQIVAHARGLSETSAGTLVLFAGPPSHEKATAAKALAKDLAKKLTRIDSADLLSKYIGETEKNLRQLFDKAEGNGAILFFDEADALFGKRSEVEDSHDRFANIEIDYLLQRVADYRGLAIITISDTQRLDDRFKGMVQFVVDFPGPACAK